jgi:hypothetical protein
VFLDWFKSINREQWHDILEAGVGHDSVVDGVGGVPWPRSDRNRLKRSRALCQWRCRERRVVRSRGDMTSGSLSEAAGVGQAKLEEHRGRRKRWIRLQEDTRRRRELSRADTGEWREGF